MSAILSLDGDWISSMTLRRSANDRSRERIFLPDYTNKDILRTKILAGPRKGRCPLLAHSGLFEPRLTTLGMCGQTVWRTGFGRRQLGTG